MGILVGPLGFGFFELSAEGSLVRVITELTLMVVLFIEVALLV